jgi:hypothetical protein
LDNIQSQLINKYLEHFCTISSTLDSFKSIFKLPYLKSIEERIAVYKSEAGDGLKSFDGIEGEEKASSVQIEARLKRYKIIANETIIRFLESNKQ